MTDCFKMRQQNEILKDSFHGCEHFWQKEHLYPELMLRIERLGDGIREGGLTQGVGCQNIIGHVKNCMMVKFPVPHV